MPAGEHVERATQYTWIDTIRSPILWAGGAGYLALWFPVLAGLGLSRTLVPGDPILKLICRGVTRLAGLEVRYVGLERLKPGEGYLYVPNHVAAIDLFVIYQALPEYCRSFEDISHFKMPLYGPVIRVVGQIPVARGDKDLNAKAVETARAMLADGHAIVSLAEGHRTLDGRLRRLYAGGFKIAIEMGAKVVPLVQRGLRRCMR